MKKTTKTLSWLAAVVLIGAVCVMGNAFFGNPVSKMLATNTAKAHLAETYPGTDYEIAKLGYSFKDGQYYAHIVSPSSVDTIFTLYFTKTGKLRLDTFECVTSGDNTVSRLDMAYRELADGVFEGKDFPKTLHIGYGTLEFTRKAFIDEYEMTDIPSYALLQDELVLDKEYDIRALGKQAGHLVIYMERDTVSVDEAARLMCDIRTLFDEANIPFRAMDFVLNYPEGDDGRRKEGEVHVAHFPYEDIHPDGMAARVKAADVSLEAYYAKEYEKKTKDIEQ